MLDEKETATTRSDITDSDGQRPDNEQAKGSYDDGETACAEAQTDAADELKDFVSMQG